MSTSPGHVLAVGSGSLDSTILARFFHSCGVQLRLLAVAYEQRHRVELAEGGRGERDGHPRVGLCPSSSDTIIPDSHQAKPPCTRISSPLPLMHERGRPWS